MSVLQQAKNDYYISLLKDHFKNVNDSVAINNLEEYYRVYHQYYREQKKTKIYKHKKKNKQYVTTDINDGFDDDDMMVGL